MLQLMILLMATRNPGNSAVEVGSLSHYFNVFFLHPRWLGMGFLNHQPYRFGLFSDLFHPKDMAVLCFMATLQLDMSIRAEFWQGFGLSINRYLIYWLKDLTQTTWHAVIMAI